MPVAVGVSLEENSTGCIFGRISGNGEWGGEIREVEDEFGEEEMLRETYFFVGRAKLDCLEGGTHEETLHPQVNPKV